MRLADRPRRRAVADRRRGHRLGEVGDGAAVGRIARRAVGAEVGRDLLHRLRAGVGDEDVAAAVAQQRGDAGGKGDVNVVGRPRQRAGDREGLAGGDPRCGARRERRRPRDGCAGSRPRTTFSSSRARTAVAAASSRGSVIVKAMVFASGDHAYCSTLSAASVSAQASPPSDRITQSLRLRLVVALRPAGRQEADVAAIGRPRRLAVAALAEGQLAGRAAGVGGDAPDVGPGVAPRGSAFGALAPRPHGEEHGRPSGDSAGLADRLQVEDVVDGDRTGLACGGQRRARQHQRHQRTAHVILRGETGSIPPGAAPRGILRKRVHAVAASRLCGHHPHPAAPLPVPAGGSDHRVRARPAHRRHQERHRRASVTCRPPTPAASGCCRRPCSPRRWRRWAASSSSPSPRTPATSSTSAASSGPASAAPAGPGTASSSRPGSSACAAAWALLTGEARVGDQVLVRGTMTFALGPKADGIPGAPTSSPVARDGLRPGRPAGRGTAPAPAACATA